MTNFSFSVSVTEYDRNTDGANFLKWKEVTSDIQSLCNYIANGYAYCNCFYHEGSTFSNKEKTNSNVKGAQLISFDFDGVKLPFIDFCNLMAETEIMPNIIYTTANNGKFKKSTETYNNRYRAVYVIDSPIYNNKLYTELHQQLKNEISIITQDNNIFNDNTDKCVSHFFAGCKHANITTDNIIYSLNWLLSKYNISTLNQHEATQSNNKGYNNSVAKDEATQSNNKSVYTNNNDYITVLLNNKLLNITTLINNKTLIPNNEDTQCNNKKGGSIIALCDPFINDYYNLSVSEIIKKYRNTYMPLSQEQTPLKDNGKLTIDLPSDYVEIRRRYKVTERVKPNGDITKLTEVTKRKDGEGRRRMIYLNLLLRKKIKPSITLEELLYFGLWELFYYVDNDGEDKITKNDIAKIAVNAFFDEVNINTTTQKKYVINKAYCAEHGINPRRANILAINQKKKEVKMCRDEKIKELYNPSLTEAANLIVMAENGIKISIRTLRRWKEENNITPKKESKPLTESKQQTESKPKKESKPLTESTSKKESKPQTIIIGVANNDNDREPQTDTTNSKWAALESELMRLRNPEELMKFDFDSYIEVLREKEVFRIMANAVGNNGIQKAEYLKKNNYIAFACFVQMQIEQGSIYKDELLKLFFSK